MIYIFFVPGMFGSTIEYVLRNFTQEYTPISAEICKDGSMHTFNKELHLTGPKDLEYLNKLDDNSIVTPKYPFEQWHLPEILSNIPNKDSDRKVLIYSDSLESSELTCLFKYYKVAYGEKYKLGMQIFCGDNQHNISSWNPAYTHWSEMQVWELREWFSVFYPNWVSEWQESANQVPDSWLKIPFDNLCSSPEQTFLKIIEHCRLTAKPDLDKFVETWFVAQKYIFDEFELIDQIVKQTLDQKLFTWNPVNIISEAIVQQRLRTKGYEIKCDGLNIFPTNSIDLYKLLEYNVSIH